ncbi:MAG: pyridoxal phosphate-dependent aminotransferase [Candidatus Thermoplasmatota archaeon]|nr:pyridoxal phosphate-dependent aminotransferase [Candidatus Thermoplasmatota archaeon]
MGNKPRSRFDFTASGMGPEIFLKSGIDFSNDEFQKEAVHAEETFYESIAEAYGVDSSEVMSTNGGSEAIQIASLYLSRESRRIVIPIPEYEPMYLVPERYGFRNFHFLRDEIYELKKDESLSFTDPNNPTGDMLSGRDFFRGALESNPVFCDETFSEFRFPARPYTNFTRYPEAVTSFTFTKFYGAGFLRVGYMFASREKIRKLKQYRLLSSGSPNIVSLYLGTKIIRKRGFFVNEVRKIIEQNRSIVRSKLSSFGLKFSDPANSTTTFVSGDFDAVWCKDLMEKHGVLVTPGKYFGMKSGFRICFTSTPENISEGLDLLGEFAGVA